MSRLENYKPTNPYKEIKQITIPIKIKYIMDYTIAGSNRYVVELPTLGISKHYDTRKEEELKEWLEFIGSEPCDSTCHECKYWRYYLKCHKLEDWERKQELRKV